MGKLRNMTAVYISDGERMLLLYRVGSRVVPPSWCGIGGHFEPHELNDARACALRELREETGILEGDLEDMKLRYITLRLKNGEVRQNYYFFATLKKIPTELPECEEGTLKWVEYSKLPELEMPHSAKYALLHYLAVGRHDECIYCGVGEKEGIKYTVLNEF